MGAGAVDEPEVLRDGVAAVHGGEHAVRSGLGGHVQVAADAGVAADNLEDIVAKVTRITGDESEAEDPGHLVVDAAQQVRESGDRGAGEGVTGVPTRISSALLGL